jgi:hypothetical protein
MTLSAQLRIAAAALAIVGASFAASSASAFTIESLGSGSADGSSRFSDPDNNLNPAPGVRLFGPGGPTMQFGAQPGGPLPYRVSPGFGSSSQPPPDPYNLNNPNRY